MTPTASYSTALHRRGSGLGLVALLLAGGLGCYRAAGVPKSTPLSYEIPASGGDRVAGLKSTGGPGDYYLGNDYVQMAVDGAPFGERPGQMGAPSGGAILDIGAIGLDQSFHRVSLPADNVDQLIPVVNQDPDLPLIFDTYRPSSTSAAAVLEMRGGILDAHQKLGAPVDANGRVIGVEVVHTITLPGRSRNFDLSTTIINHTGTALPIYSIGDCLRQRGGGFRVLVAGQESSGIAPGVSSGSNAAGVAPVPVRTWAADIPGSDFSTTTGGTEDPAKRFNPLATAVKAYNLGLQGGEPSAESLDFHQSLTIASLDTTRVLVSSDPQNALLDNRPRFPSRVVVGSLPRLDNAGQPLPLASGDSRVHNRRIYTVSGSSLIEFYELGIPIPLFPSQTTVPQNEAAGERASIFGQTVGGIAYGTIGTAARGGAVQTEIRFERYLGPSGMNPWDPENDLTDDSRWILEGVEWLEPGENRAGSTGSRSTTLPVFADPLNSAYRIRLSNRLATQSWTLLTNLNGNRTSSLPSVLTPLTDGPFVIAEPLAPELGPGLVGPSGNVVGSLMTSHLVATRELNSETNVFQPARLVFLGLDGTGAPDPSLDPVLQRVRFYFGTYNLYTRSKIINLPLGGIYAFRAGNECFGASFDIDLSLGTNNTLPVPLVPGNYRLVGSHGPMNPLAQKRFSSVPNSGPTLHALRMTNPGLPQSWISFDLPSPTQATTGGMVPAEMLTSALAEDVHVVARTEEDLLTSPSALYQDFRLDLTNSYVAAAQRAVIGQDPLVVGARSSTLWSPGAKDGRVTALFTPEPSSARLGGARSSAGWTLADFQANADGAFYVVHRPRDPGNPSDPSVPQGLFQSHGFDPLVPLGSGVNAWWNQTTPRSAGRRMGDFDALELIRAEYSDASGPKDLRVAANASAWFAEFKTVRNDWFALLKQQTPSAFTKALGLSGAKFSLDTPVGLARTYLKLGAAIDQSTLGPVLDALRSGHAVASTGPFLDVTVGSQGPGGFLSGTNASASLSVTVIAPDWVPVDEVRVVVNGTVVSTIPFNASNFTQDPVDSRKWVLTNPAYTTLTFTPGKDAFVVVEAGVPLATSGAYAAGTPWAQVMHGIYPIAVTNPVFVDVDGGGYTAPGLP
jgi:hypothetical protein